MSSPTVITASALTDWFAQALTASVSRLKRGALTERWQGAQRDLKRSLRP
ncbi:hypothetical protein R69927_03559 [Paraburkholderia domus]|nr:hypothetical protein R75471_00870 [Paraburkholderia domus]CAE6872827.1 hypothetical protein R69927_03559 [Paraburkholderia domus]